MSKKLLLAIASAAGIAAATTAVAAPLPNTTKLSLTMGVGATTNTPCSSGTCFGMEIIAGVVTAWANYGGGTDGGFVLGKDQKSGGQEFSEPGTGGTPTNSAAGELTTAWNFGGTGARSSRHRSPA